MNTETQKPYDAGQLIDDIHDNTGLSYSAIFWIFIIGIIIWVFIEGVKVNKRERKEDKKRMREEWFKKKGITEEEWLKHNKNESYNDKK